MSSSAGSRGGPKPPMTKERAMRLYETWRADEYGGVKAEILRIACEKGEVHGDDVAHLALGERNIVGIAFNSLRGSNLLQSTGEHRVSKNPASHGRRSYVYRPTQEGRMLHEKLKLMPIRLAPKQEGLF